MGTEAIALILCMAVAAVLAMLMGRMLSLLLKITIVVALVYFAVTRINFKNMEMCRPAHETLSSFAQVLCR